jgi:hypothetical protein
MAYIDGLLASGERMVRREHQHWFVLVADAAYGIIALAIALLVVFLASGMEEGTIRSLLGNFVLVIVIGGLIYMGWQVLHWMNEEFVVTTRRVLQLEGVVNKKVTDSSLEKINDAVLEQSVFGRMLGYGDLDILTAADVAIDKYRMLNKAPGFKKAMLDQKHALETEFAHIPGPPLRAPGTGGRSMSADEVTRALGDLAALRDKGALTTEDYERKKQELLARI